MNSDRGVLNFFGTLPLKPPGVEIVGGVNMGWFEHQPKCRLFYRARPNYRILGRRLAFRSGDDGASSSANDPSQTKCVFAFWQRREDGPCLVWGFWTSSCVTDRELDHFIHPDDSSKEGDMTFVTCEHYFIF